MKKSKYSQRDLFLGENSDSKLFKTQMKTKMAKKHSLLISSSAAISAR